MADKLTVYEFGKQLLETKDLDPVYVILWHSGMSQQELARWLVGYWCFYHVGVASWLADNSEEKFWKALSGAWPGTTHPRASERRHFRGQQAENTVKSLVNRKQSCLAIVQSFKGDNLASVSGNVQTVRGFGDWISFKIADMLERLGLCKVEFSKNDVFEMYDTPRKGAELMAEVHGPATGNVYNWAYGKLLAKLGHKLAPPRFERKINVQEIETILCKWKSHRNGHYAVKKDIHEVHEGLLRYKQSKLSQRLINAGKAGGLW